MIKLIHHIWNLLIHPYQPEDCVATCIFTILFARGQFFAAQLGDGLLYFQGGESPFCLVEGRDAGFSNETIGLGLAKSLSDWHYTEKILPSAFTLMLCTDGVADDILPERRADFVKYLRDEMDPLPPRRRSSLLRRELTNWPTPGHIDDKSLVLAWR
jgi:serine/threonine protein phosphatase PrpC